MNIILITIKIICKPLSHLISCDISRFPFLQENIENNVLKKGKLNIDWVSNINATILINVSFFKEFWLIKI